MKLTNNLLNNQNYIMWKAEYNDVGVYHNTNFVLSTRENMNNQLWGGLMLTLISLVMVVLMMIVLTSGSMIILFLTFLWLPIFLFYVYYQEKKRPMTRSFPFIIIKKKPFNYFIGSTMINYWMTERFFEKYYGSIKKNKLWN